MKTQYKSLVYHFTLKHLHRYLEKFEMRWIMSILEQYNRLNEMLGSTSGLCLTYAKSLK